MVVVNVVYSPEVNPMEQGLKKHSRKRHVQYMFSRIMCRHQPRDSRHSFFKTC